jgi:LysR family glycine cleavage system transcriptional activator
MHGRKHLGHLNAWRALEAAARNSSFVIAADELFVTPAAISHQVKLLEAYLGIALFRRTARGVVLTNAAASILPELTAAFDQLNRSIGRLRRRNSGAVVTITVPPSFATKWLVPRLERFRTLHPGVDVRIDTTDRLVDFESEDIDLGVRYGFGDYPDLQVEPLLGEEVFPVCSPELADRLGMPVTAAALAKATLIHDTTIQFNDEFPNWESWIEHVHGDRGELDVSRGLHVNSSILAIEAAIGGQGVALGRSVIVADDLHAGRLVRPYGEDSIKGCTYHVVLPKESLEHRHIALFRDWLVSEARCSKP